MRTVQRTPKRLGGVGKEVSLDYRIKDGIFFFFLSRKIGVMGYIADICKNHQNIYTESEDKERFLK